MAAHEDVVMSDMADAVDVTVDNYQAALSMATDAVNECDFIAFDCEMTGLFLDGDDDNRHSYLDDMSARYDKVHASAQKFIINQFGLAAFTLVDGRYVAKTFNFNIFPRSFQQTDKRFVSQASSLEYLAKHNFDFNKMIYKGISYMPLKQQERMLQDVDKPARFARREANSDADRSFVASLTDNVKRWHDAGAEATLLVAEGVNAFKRSLAYQALEDLKLGDDGKSAGFYVEKVGDYPNSALRVTRATEAEAAAHAAAVREQKLADIKEAGGFSNIMHILKASRKPVIGHNMLFDVVYVLNMFVQDYPTWQACQVAVAEWFPGGVYDTKYLSKHLAAKHPEHPELIAETSLGPMFEHLQRVDPELQHVALLEGASVGSRWFAVPQVEHADGFVRYAGAAGAAFAHEAGFDAYMTGACFSQLLALLSASYDDAGTAAAAVAQGQGSEPAQAARERGAIATNLEAIRLDIVAQFNGRVNLMRSDMPYCSLMGPDPELPRPNVVVMVASDKDVLPMYKVRRAVKETAEDIGAVRTELLHVEGAWAAQAVTLGDASTVTAEVAADLATKLQSHSVCEGCQVMTWQAYTAWKHSRMYSGQDEPGKGGKGAAAMPYNMVRGALEAAVGLKRSRSEPCNQSSRTGCTIM